MGENVKEDEGTQLLHQDESLLLTKLENNLYHNILYYLKPFELYKFSKTCKLVQGRSISYNKKHHFEANVSFLICGNFCIPDFTKDCSQITCCRYYSDSPTCAFTVKKFPEKCFLLFGDKELCSDLPKDQGSLSLNKVRGLTIQIFVT